MTEENDKTIEELEEEYKKILLEKIKTMQEETIESTEETPDVEEKESSEKETNTENSEEPKASDETEELRKRIQELEEKLSQQKTVKYTVDKEDLKKIGVEYLKKAANTDTKIIWKGGY